MKVAGSYGSLIRGVSQQAPEVRVDGQHTEQVNMMSDPVAGLTRRRGTIFKAKKSLTTSNAAAAVGTFGGYREVEHTTGGKDYLILVREQASANASNASLPPALCYNRTDHVWLDVSWPSTAQSDFINANGIAAAISIGRYLLFAAKNKPCTKVDTQVYGVTTNHAPVVWVRGGNYNRTYSVRTPQGYTYSYTTPDSTAAGASSYITPEYIASQLAAGLTALSIPGVVRNGAHFTFSATFDQAQAVGQDGSHVIINPSQGGGDIAVSDGGDGTMIRGVYAVVDSVDKLPLMGVNGQIVRVQPGPDSWFYVRAHNKGDTGLSETIWREAAGNQQATSVLGLGCARIVGTTLYIGYGEAGNPTGLSHMPAQPEPVPTVVPADVGDEVTCPPPRWLANQITFMSLFQDRLLIGSGAACAVSGVGDYLNFFRTTTQTITASDPFEMVAQGGEDDTLRWGVSYNRNLVVFGDKRQYLISGTVTLSPTSANMSIMTVYPDAAEARPVAAGGQIYYARNREGNVAVHQIQPGAYVDSAESFPASGQVGTYIPAPAASLETVPGAPSLLLVRSRSTPQGLYTFSYLDAPDGRKQDAWYRWEFNPQCGNLVSMANSPDGLILLWARVVNGVLYMVSDLMPLTTGDPTLPYLDSMRKVSALGEITAAQAGWSVAFDATTDRFLIGGDLAADTASLQAEYPTEAPSLWAGLSFDSYVIPTNPYARDGEGKALLSGRTVVTMLRVNTRKSSGIAWDVTAGGSTTSREFNGRRLGSSLNLIGTVPIDSTIVSVPIGRETRAYEVKLKARRWFPLNLVGIEWTGQSFNRTPRANH